MKKLIQNLMIPLLFLLFLAACSHREQTQITIHLVGDSTMADKPHPEVNAEKGWGQMLQLYFNDHASILNHAVNGRSTRSFINEGRWNEVVNALNPGDYVLIQFGHNDQKSYDPDRYSNPYSSYRRNLEKMVMESREKGAFPVILSSIVRRKFNSAGSLEDSHGPYPFVARQVAEQNEVPFIDLQQQTEDLVMGLGPDRSSALYLILKPGENEMHPDGITDNTHLNLSGASEVAGMVASAVGTLGIPLADYLAPANANPRILIITGGHNYDTTEFSDLFRSMKEIRFDTISHPHATGLLASAYIDNYDVLVFYDYMPDLPEKDSSIFQNLAHDGMPMLFMHHSICSFQRWDGYKKMLGGKYVMPAYGDDPASLSDYHHDLDLHVSVAPELHPITKNMSDFNILDEGYSNIEMAEGIVPLLLTDHPESSSPVAWVNEYDHSAIICLMLGHDKHAYQNPSLEKFLQNSIYWLSETH